MNSTKIQALQEDLERFELQILQELWTLESGLLELTRRIQDLELQLAKLSSD